MGQKPLSRSPPAVSRKAPSSLPCRKPSSSPAVSGCNFSSDWLIRTLKVGVVPGHGWLSFAEFRYDGNTAVVVRIIMIPTLSCVLSWCVPRGLHFGVCLGVYLGVLGQGRGSLMRPQSRRNTVIYTGLFAIMFTIRLSNSFYSLLRIQSLFYSRDFITLSLCR